MNHPSQRIVPTPEEFRALAQREFAFLRDEYGYRERPVPTDVNPYLNRCAVWFENASTRIIVEGRSWGLDARVALGGNGGIMEFENYDLEDLIEIRTDRALASGPAKQRPGGQVEQLASYARSLRDVARDVLLGDHSVSSELALRVERRKQERDAAQDRRA